MPDIARQQFWNGAAQDQGHRNESAQYVFDELLRDPNKAFATVLCGDMMVIAQRRGEVIIITDCIVRRRTDYNPDGTHVYPERSLTR